MPLSDDGVGDIRYRLDSMGSRVRISLWCCGDVLRRLVSEITDEGDITVIQYHSSTFAAAS